MSEQPKGVSVEEFFGDGEGPSPQSPSPFDIIFGGMMTYSPSFSKAIKELAALTTLDEVLKKPMPGKPFHRGVMGFRRRGRNLTIAIGCGCAMVREIALPKYVALIQNMNADLGVSGGRIEKDGLSATIVLEHYTEPDENRLPRGQVLGRLIPEFSAIVIAQGLAGKVIHSTRDIVKFDTYYLPKEALAAFYVSSKIQNGTQDLLDELIGAHDGWKSFGIPRDPCQPEL